MTTTQEDLSQAPDSSAAADRRDRAPSGPPRHPPTALAAGRNEDPPDDQVTCSFAIRPEKRYLVHNRTPKRMKVMSEGGVLDLPPLSQRVICGDRLVPFAGLLREQRQRHRVSVREHQEARKPSRLPIMLVWLAFIALIVIALANVLTDGTLHTREAVVAGAVTGVVLLVVLAVAASRERRRLAQELTADWRDGDIDYGVGAAYYDGNETLRRTKHILTFLIVIAIGAVLPAIAIFVATDAKDFFTMKGGLEVLGGKESRLVSRMIQVTYTAVLSLFPALLYFQFDRQRVGMIRGTWVRAIFRMDERMDTLSDVNARYGDELSEASSYSTDSVRFLGGRNSPIIVATILISLGWTILVLRTDSFDFAGATRVSTLAQSAQDAAERADAAATEVPTDAAGSDPAAAAASAALDQAAQSADAAAGVAARSADVSIETTPTTSGDAPDTDAQAAAQDAAGSAAQAAERAAAAESYVQEPFFQLLVPTPTAATMAFLGAYFFGVYLVLRGYFRGDLRPKVYNQITARLVTVVVLAYLISALFSEGGERNRLIWSLSFLAGIVPTTVLQRFDLIASSFAGRFYGRQGFGGAFAKAFATPRPLSHIDGVDLQESSRLESEGMPDLASLAKSNLVSVMVNTRLPVDRLVDWTDQAVLILLMDDGGNDRLDERVTKLRRMGIRTASGVLRFAETADPDARRQVEQILSSGRGGMSLDLLVDQIEREPAMGRVRQWFRSDLSDVTGECQTIEVGPDPPTGGAPPSAGGGADPDS